MLHSLNRTLWEKAKQWDVLSFLQEQRRQGRIRHVGFSFHGDIALFREVVDAFDWAFCIIQYNFMDTDHQAGTEGLCYAAEKGLGVMVMEPLKGGQLAKQPPKAVTQVWAKSAWQESAASRALRFVWNRPEVTVALSGMNELQQLKENLALAQQVKAGGLPPEELALYQNARNAYEELIQIPCTRCQYCRPCPAGVDIPSNFDYYNMGYMYDSIAHARQFYLRPFFDDKRSTNCISCNACLPKCPQHLPIPQWLAKISSQWAGENREIPKDD
ncbi:MAG TPA: aldo/keto reductase [Firmicutes bacterium]|nr:aldo/keto reductase [Bacillota bacterium]